MVTCQVAQCRGESVVYFFKGAQHTPKRPVQSTGSEPGQLVDSYDALAFPQAGGH